MTLESSLMACWDSAAFCVSRMKFGQFLLVNFQILYTYIVEHRAVTSFYFGLQACPIAEQSFQYHNDCARG